MATSRPRDIDRETYSALKAAQESSQLPSSVNPFKTALSGPTWFVKTLKFDDVAFKASSNAITVTLLDLSSAVAGNPEARNDVIFYDAFIDTTTLWAGVNTITFKVGLDKGTRNDATADFTGTPQPEALLTAISIDDSGEDIVAGQGGGAKGSLIPNDVNGVPHASRALVDKPRIFCTLGAASALGTGTATNLTAGELRVYFCIATPVSLDADSGFGVVT
jgi:hypothetical protein